MVIIRLTPKSSTAVSSAMLSASVPPEVKISSEEWQFNQAAMERREVSNKALEFRP